MSEGRRQRVEEIFHECLGLAPGERAAALDRSCAGDEKLRARVERLLRHAGENGETVFDGPVFSMPNASRLPGNVPEHIGRYRLVRLIGEGGMGSVYEAQQESPRRTVALKVIRPGLATRGVLKRFQQETQVLGRLSHPGIAQIYEAGVVDRLGRLVDPNAPADEREQRQPFFAMEFVNGVPIDQYAEKQSLGTRERLTLVALAADAVEHAHRQGIVHRDLKPGNVLVDEVNGVPRARVLDFGVAHVADEETMSATLRTGVGELIGTLPYMSPEQATGNVDALDARADVYSLGVLAFQLLTGRLPLDLSRRAIPEAARMIREEEPSKLGALNTSYRGDVETIVAKALEKDPARRYRAAGEFAADIRRHLRDEPIVARPPGTLYQIGKFVRRNRGLAAGVGAAFGALTIGLIGMAYMALEEREQRRVAVAKTLEADRRAYRAGLTAAQAALEQDDSALASASLRATPEALRGWEWRHLSARAEPWLRRFSLPYPVGVACISSDGRTLASAHDGRVRIWDAFTGAKVREFEARRPVCVAIALTPDASRVFLSSEDGVIEMRDAQTGDVVWRIVERRRSDWPASLSPDGRLAALPVNDDREVQLVDAADGRFVKTIEVASLLPTPMFSRDGKRIAFTGPAIDGSAALYDADEGIVWAKKAQEFLAITADGERAALIERGSRRGRITIVGADTGAVLEGLELPEVGFGYSGEFRPDGAVLAFHAARGAIQIRDAAALSPVASVAPGTLKAWFRYTADGSRLVAVSADGTVSHWDGHIGPMPMSTTLFHSGSSAAFSSDRRRAFIGDWGTVNSWNTMTGELEWTRNLSIRDVRATAVSRDDKWVAADASRGRVAVLDAATGEIVHRTPRRDVEVTALAWDAAGLVVAFDDGTMERFDPMNAGAGATALRGAGGPQGWLVVSPDGSNVVGVPHAEWRRSRGAPAPAAASGQKDGALMWSGSESDATRVLEGGDVKCVAYDADGALMAAAIEGRGIEIVDARNRAVRFRLRMEAGSRVRAIAFSADGTRLAASCEDQTIHLWDVMIEDELAVFHADGRLGLAFDRERDALLAIGGRTLTAFEARQAAADVLEARERTARAVGLLLPLIEEQHPRERRAASVVARLIQEDTNATPGTVEAALRLLRARGDHGAALNSNAWGMVLPRTGTPEQYEVGMDLAKLASETLPGDPGVLNTLGTAQVRARRFEEAITTFRTCAELWAREGMPPHPTDLALSAMALQGLGRTSEAREKLEEARRQAAAQGLATDSETRTFIDEAAEVVK